MRGDQEAKAWLGQTVSILLGTEVNRSIYASDVGVIVNFLGLGNEQYLFLVNIKFGA